MSSQPPTVSLAPEAEPRPLTPADRFRFSCHPGLACFNRCCRTPTALLSPYDLWRLKQALGLTSREVLDRYTRPVIEASLNLPLIFLDPSRTPGGGCPFVGAGGCTVYAHRPAACRLFPVTMGSQYTPQGVVDYYFCRTPEYCLGFQDGQEWTVAAWMASQGFDEYHRGRRAWLEIILSLGAGPPPRFDNRRRELYATCAYDLEGLRALLADAAFRRACGLPAAAGDYGDRPDQDLLTVSIQCVQAVLAGAADAALD